MKFNFVVVGLTVGLLLVGGAFKTAELAQPIFESAMEDVRAGQYGN